MGKVPDNNAGQIENRHAGLVAQAKLTFGKPSLIAFDFSKLAIFV